MTNQPVATALKDVLANSYALYLKTQNFHWNVTGPNFRSLHTLFEEQYIDLREAIDVVAERIRALGVKAPGGFKAFSKLAVITDGDENTTDLDMVRELRDDQLTLVQYLKKALKAAEKHDDDATGDFMVARIQYHQQQAWMLSATLGEEVPKDSKLNAVA